MAVTVKSKQLLTIPDEVRRRAGLKNGDRVEFKVSGGVINIVPKPTPTDNENTPEQRRLIDARLREAGKGPYYGPFACVDEMLASMKRKKPTAARARRRP